MNQTADDFEDRELPDESDMDAEGDEGGADTDPCPHCGKTVYIESEWCPHCGNPISPQTGGSRKSLWIAVVVAICLFVIVVCWIL